MDGTEKAGRENNEKVHLVVHVLKTCDGHNNSLPSGLRVYPIVWSVECDYDLTKKSTVTVLHEINLRFCVERTLFCLIYRGNKLWVNSGFFVHKLANF